MINITAARQTGMYTLIEQNFIERMRFCSHAARVQHRNNRTFAWLRTGINYPNVFLNLVWSRNVGYNYLGQEVDLLVNHLSQKEAPIFWALNPELPSAFHTSQRLEALGFSMESPVHGMTMLLDGANTQVDTPEGLVIQRVYEPQSLEAFLGVLSARYTYSTSAAQQWQGMESRLGFGLHSIWQRYVGLWKGEPVATAAVFMGSSAAGIYHVETLSHARGKGIGTAMVAHALHEAQRRGYFFSVLVATDMGFNLYRRLGFQTSYDLHLWER